VTESCFDAGLDDLLVEVELEVADVIQIHF
jgi:hypothetical protein